jgi:hypothetical protein
MTSAKTNKQITRLPDRPLINEIYRDAGSDYKVLALFEDACGLCARVRRLKDGWTCFARHPALYQMEDGSIEMQWDYSTGGFFDN